MSDKAFAVSTVAMFVWVTIWMLSYYEQLWLKIPVIADLFPLPLPNGTLSYAQAVTSIGIMGTLVLAMFIGYYSMKAGKRVSGGLMHR